MEKWSNNRYCSFWKITEFPNLTISKIKQKLILPFEKLLISLGVQIISKKKVHFNIRNIFFWMGMLVFWMEKNSENLFILQLWKSLKIIIDKFIKQLKFWNCSISKISIFSKFHNFYNHQNLKNFQFGKLSCMYFECSNNLNKHKFFFKLIIKNRITRLSLF